MKKHGIATVFGERIETLKKWLFGENEFKYGF